MKLFAKQTAALVMTLCLSLPAWAISTDEEIQLGAQAAARFEQQHGLVSDSQMNARLNRIAQRLLTGAERKNLPWKFRIINVDQFNAAAFPGGFIYATRGLMQGLDDEELAFVIGHEIGHVDKRHSVEQIESAQLRRLGLIAIAAGATGGDIDRNVGTLVQLTDSIIGSQRSQGDEAESDRYGLRLMAQAGYDPAFALSALQTLASQSSGGTPGFLNTLLGSHPLPKERIEEGADLITSVPYRPEALPPVTSASGQDRIFPEATSALRYTLNLSGMSESDVLSNRAEQIALGGGQAVFGNQQLVRVVGPVSEGLAGLENQLLRKAELRNARAFGASVVQHSAEQVEAVVIVQGGTQ